jgi:NAD(P)H-hydrate repair Nnr-like enzyme with NAD(P)H-hydrate dehydratase domain
VDAVASDVQLVMVGGKILYGDAPIMRALPAAALTGCEDVTVCGSTRVACVARPTTADMMNQTLAQISAEIRGFYPGALPLVPRCP